MARESQNRTYKNLVKACFDAMKQHKQEEKFNKVTDELFNRELPLKERTIQYIEQVTADNRLKCRGIALNNLQQIRTK